jgi:hypothetical protein
LRQIEDDRRADRIEDMAMARWGGKNTSKHVQALRKKR